MDLLGVVAGEFEPAIQRIWGPEAPSRYLAADKKRRHLWHLCLAHGMVADRARLERSTAQALLAASIGPVPGVRGLLAKLGSFAWAADDYRLLVRLLKDGGPGAKLVRHAGSLDAGLVRKLAELPLDLRREDVLRVCCDALSVAYLNWLMRRGAPYGMTFDPTRAARYLVASWRSLDECFTHPDDGFPPPPFVPDGFVPLRDRKTLADAAQRFQNCLKSVAVSVLDGKAYYFSIEGEHPAVVSIENVAPFGWRIGEALGVGNQPLPRTARASIATAFAHHDVFVEPLLEEEET